MAENGEVDDDLNDEPTPKDLRKQLAKAHKDNESLLQRLSELEAKDRVRTISDIVADAGLPAKVAKLLPSSVEPTEESVKAWISEYEDVFGKVEQTEQSNGSNEEGNADPGNSPEARAARERMATATAGGAPAGALADLQSKIANAKTPQELTEILQSATN